MKPDFVFKKKGEGYVVLETKCPKIKESTPLVSRPA